MEDPKPCSSCRRVFQRQEFNPSSGERRSWICRPCLKVKNHEYYCRAQETRLTWESSRVHEGITVELYKQVVRAHSGRCFISHAIGKPLVLIPVSLRGPLEGEPLKWTDFVPVIRSHAHLSVLPDAHRKRFQGWLRARNGPSSAFIAAEPTTAPPPPPRRPPLVTKGAVVGGPTKSQIEHYLIEKAVQSGLDPDELYTGLLFAKRRRLSPQ